MRGLGENTKDSKSTQTMKSGINYEHVINERRTEKNHYKSPLDIQDLGGALSNEEFEKASSQNKQSIHVHVSHKTS